MYFSKSLIASAAYASVVLGANHAVIVGQNNGLTFTPQTIDAAAGDTVTFAFATQNHTVTSGNANGAGCTPDGQVNSGFVPAPGAAQAAQAAQAGANNGGQNNGGRNGNHKFAIRGENNIFDLDARANGNLPTFTMTVQNTNPMVIYCAQAQHCQSNMVMVINPANTGATSLVAWQRKCSQAKTNVPANGVTGGTLANLVQTANNGNTGNQGNNGKQGKQGKQGN